ncbi:MAG TPA: BREX system P-loop protein BrxC, partial [Candidatus Hydrogenedentes bacterium]|nr:BREX system P-loop protein BrxC [Candidatus Hydrogenedentota bacterium]
MQIQSLFARDIFRPINGVVKADQLDESSVWQELDEFVVTREMHRIFRDFFTAYCAAIDNPNNADVAGRTGVWVSGFFGSGKSHFLKVLSYLLRNAEHAHDGETRRAVDFFDGKIDDALLLAPTGDLFRPLVR